MLHAFIAVLALVAGPEIPISEPVIAPRPGLRFQPKVATNGSDYLIAWAEVGELRAASGTGDALAVASDGRDYVIAYDCSNAYVPKSICMARVDASTGNVEPGGRVEKALYPAIASAGGRYLLAYQTPYTATTTDVRAIEVAENAAPI